MLGLNLVKSYSKTNHFVLVPGRFVLNISDSEQNRTRCTQDQVGPGVQGINSTHKLSLIDN
jgi:hypothetical protein